MKWFALLGLIVAAYSLFVFYVTFKRPKKIWGMKKIQGFEKALGLRGTQVLFAVFGAGLLALGIWLMVM